MPLPREDDNYDPKKKEKKMTGWGDERTVNNCKNYQQTLFPDTTVRGCTVTKIKALYGLSLYWRNPIIL